MKKNGEKNNKNSEKNKNYEYASLNPEWIERRVPDNYADDGLKKIILFYVINTPCYKDSASSILISEYGWSDNVWQDGTLRKELFSVANLKKDKTLFVGKKLSDMKSVFEKAKMKKDFHKKREIEKIAFYKTSKYPNEMMSVFQHIRNSLAHGRLAMYACDSDDVMFVLEDGIGNSTHFEVRSRMILKKSTLLKWIDIITAGPSALENYEEKEVEK